MDKIIHKHLDNRIEIQDKLAGKIDKLIEEINIDRLIANPKAELNRVSKVALIETERLTEKAADEGIRFGQEVKKRDKQDKDVKFIKSKDPNLNKGEL